MSFGGLVGELCVAGVCAEAIQERRERPRGSLFDDAVPYRVDSIRPVAARIRLIGISLHPSGIPISHSGKRGSRRRPSSDFDPALPLLAATLGCIALTSSSSAPVRAIVNKLAVPALGRSNSPPLPLMPFCELPYVDAVGVGSEQEETISDVRGADGSRGTTVPLRNPPARDQELEDFAERATFVDGEQPGHVLEKQHRRSTLVDDAGDMGPEPPLVAGSCTLAGQAGALARDAGNDEIHAAMPRSAVEAAQVIPDRSRRHGRFFHPGHESGCAVGRAFDSTNKAGRYDSSDGPLGDSEASAECHGAKSQAIVSHVQG